jgi:hypothetical protein
MNWKEFKLNRRKTITLVIVLIIVSLISSNWLLYDNSASDSPKGIGFPFAFYIGGGGLCPDKNVPQGVICPFNFYYEFFLIDLIIWVAISFCLYFLILSVYNKIKKK